MDYDANDHVEALFNKTYLRWFDLNGEPALCEIRSVEKGVEMTLPGGAQVKRPVLKLELERGKITEMKPLVLNTTNSNSIAEIHGVKPSEWIGKGIVLFQTVTKCKGKEVPCIRIRKRKDK